MRWKFELQHPTQNGNNFLVIDEPEGWDNAEFIIKRDTKYHGITIAYSFPLTFWGTGYDFLHSVTQNAQGGVDTNVNIRISLACSETDPFQVVYNGKINLLSIKFEFDDWLCLASANIEQDDAKTRFLQRTNQKINLLSAQTLDNNTLSNPPSFPYNNQPIYDIDSHSKTIKKRLIRGAPNELLPLSSLFETTIPGSQISIFHWHAQARLLFLGDSNFLVNDFSSNYNQGPAVIDGWYDFGRIPSPPFGSHIFEAQEDGDYKIDLCDWAVRSDLSFSNNYNPISVNCTNQDDYENIDVRLYIQIGSTPPLLLASCTFSCQSSVTCVFGNNNYNAIHSLLAGEKIFIWIDYGWETHVYPNPLITQVLSAYITTVSFLINPYNGKRSCLSIVVESKIEETKIKGILAYEALDRIIENISDKQFQLKSNLFGRTNSFPISEPTDGCGSKHILTNGLLIRGIETNELLVADSCCNQPNNNNPPAPVVTALMTSFDDLFDAENAVWNIGLAFENNLIRIESKKYFYQNSIVLNIDKIPNFTRSPIESEHINRIVAGYEKWEAEFVNGIDEFNTKREYTAGYKFVNSEFTQTRCRFITSGYAIEATRRQKPSTNGTTDWKYDNDLFFICVQQTNLKKTERGDSKQINGVTDAFTLYPVSHPLFNASGGLIDWQSLYNLRLAPQRNIQRWLPILLAHFPNQIANFIQESYYEGNNNERIINTDPCCPEQLSAVNPTRYRLLSPGGSFEQPVCQRPYYYLEEIIFDYPLTFLQLNTLLANPYGKIEINFHDNTIGHFFIREIKYKPAEGMANFKLIKAYPFS